MRCSATACKAKPRALLLIIPNLATNFGAKEHRSASGSNRQLPSEAHLRGSSWQWPHCTTRPVRIKSLKLMDTTGLGTARSPAAGSSSASLGKKKSGETLQHAHTCCCAEHPSHLTHSSRQSTDGIHPKTEREDG